MISTIDLVNLGKNVIANSAPLIVPLMKEGISKLEQWSKAYNDYHHQQMIHLQGHYTKYCYPLESKHPLTTLNISKHGGELETEKNLPIYLLMEGKFPALYMKKFKPKILMDDWVIYVERGLLKPVIEEMLGYLCQYQVERNGLFWQFTDRDKPCEYDPTNLFFEEFKAWLVYLSYARIDSNSAPKLCEVISGRIKYLNAIITARVFDPMKEHPPTRSDILQRVHDQLLKCVLPLIQNEISRQTAREHFENLRINIKNALHYGIRFLFYILRDSKHTPQNFILSQIRSPSMPFYQEISKDTSTQLLRCLVTTPMLNFVFPVVDDATQFHSSYSMQELMVNPFSNGVGDTVYPMALVSKTQNSDNWYIGSSSSSGIYSYFCTLRCDIRLLSTFVMKNYEDTIKGGKEIILVKDKNDFIVYYKNKSDEIVESFSCSPELKQLLLPLVFDGKILPQSLEEIYKRVHEEINAKGGYVRSPINCFTELHKLLHKLSAFYLVCDLLYDIAGDGGNILVYGKAMHLVQGVVDELRVLLDNISSYSKLLHQEANILKVRLDAKTMQETQAASSWRRNYTCSDLGYEQLHSNMQLARASLEHVSLGVYKVNQTNYLNAVHQKLILLENVTRLLGIKSENIKIAQAPALLLESKDFKEEKALALTLYREEQYTTAYAKLFKLHQQDEKDDEVNYILAEILWLIGTPQHLTKALEFLQRCIDHNEKSEYGKAALFLKACVLKKQENYVDAEQAVEILLSLANPKEDLTDIMQLKKEITEASSVNKKEVVIKLSV